MPRPNRSTLIDIVLTQLVESHPRDLVSTVADVVGVSRSAVAARVRQLIADGILEKDGSTRPTYRPGPKHMRMFPYLRTELAEDRVWREDIRPLLQHLPANVLEIFEYGVTEMVNNAIDHSEGEFVMVVLYRAPRFTQCVVADNGVGIFAKIARAKALPDERLALLELSKGKLTTDPSRHSGEGIFFTSRIFDGFAIQSGDLLFSHRDGRNKDLLLDAPHPLNSDQRFETIVSMRIANDSPRRIGDVFAEYSSGPDEYAFAKTVVPVRMAKLGDENLISRSQAKRVLQGVHRFRHIVFDFSAVDRIGQAFADEIFRVFALANPEIEIEHVNATPEIQQMIRRAEVLRDENAAASNRTQTPEP